MQDKKVVVLEQNGISRAVVVETLRYKSVRSPIYNYDFDKTNGYFMRWGKSLDDDPLFSPFGPEILDLEISINGCPNNCPFCYKGNTPKEPTNMSFETFKTILDKFPPTLTQIAFGITGVQTNPDFIKMLRYCREKGVIPNYTLTGIDLTDEIAEQSAELCGAIAVSVYQSDKNICYDTVKRFVDLGVQQINIHILVSEQTMDFVYEVLQDILSDERLKGLNAILFLGVKPKGRAKGKYAPTSLENYRKLIEYCQEHKIFYGFDSCSAPKAYLIFSQMDKPDEWKNRTLELVESCESSLFSSYINVHGEYWHCSFCENEDVPFVDVLKVRDFLRDVWYSEEVQKFRSLLLSTDKPYRECPVYPEVNPE